MVPIDDSKRSCLCEPCLDAISQNLRCFRLHVAYVGQQFHGYQQQDNARTVEGELKRALARIFTQPLKLITAGRTDAGVHARGQVLALTTSTKLSARQITLALSSLLPHDVAVFKIDEMPLGFDARRQSIGKQYIFRITQGLVADPFWYGRALHIRQELDVGLMAEAARYFVGEHDFSSFRASLCTASHARRYIWHVGVVKNDTLISIDVRGNAFCLNQVRIMAGTLIEVGRGKRTPLSIRDALLGHDRKLAGITAQACGLTLERVYYPDDLSDAGIPKGAVFPRYPVSRDSWPWLNIP